MGKLASSYYGMELHNGINMDENMQLSKSREELFRYLRQEIGDDKVLRAMEQVSRECFVPPVSRHLAYEDIPLSIGEEQTISQPFIIALMTSALELTGQERVLEVGTGSGYQAAILSQLVGWVVTVERLPNLAESAKQRLRKLGYSNIEVHVAGETLGWGKGAPYDAIIVTAGAPQVPEELVKQLACKGYMVIPVGGRLEQRLIKVTKGEGGVTTEDLGGCRFVPLKGKGGWEDE